MGNTIIEFLVLNGVDGNLLYVLLVFPLLFTVVSFARYIVGVRTNGAYALIATIGLYVSVGSNLSSPGSKPDFWIGFLHASFMIVLSFTITCIGYSIYRKLQLHYFSKIVFVLSLTVMGVFLTLLASANLENNLLMHLNINSAILLLILSEDVLSNYAKKGFSYTVTVLTNTVILSIISFGIICSDYISHIVLAQPWIAVVFIVINLVIGKYTGLRLSEYVRFYDLLLDKNDIDDENSTDTEE